MKKGVLIFSVLLVCASCKKITKEDLQGEWHFFDYEKEDSFFDLNFIGDSVKLIDGISFTEVGVYHIDKNELTVKLNRADFEIKTKIEKFWKDSLVLSNGMKYYKSPEDDYWLTPCVWDDYRLVNIKTKTLYSDEVQKKDNFSIVHFYKKDGETKIRYNYRYLDYKDLININYACSGGEPIFYRILVYLDKNISLKELKKFYYHLELYGNRPIWLATKRFKFTDTYLLKVDIKILRDDRVLYEKKLNNSVPPPPPPKEEFNNKEDFISRGWKLIEINELNDLEKLEKLNKAAQYLVVIHPDLELKTYLELQKILNEKSELLESEIVAVID
ncbi:hypothetical protein [Wenyingzhuangia sp. IMCC45574]